MTEESQHSGPDTSKIAAEILDKFDEDEAKLGFDKAVEESPAYARTILRELGSFKINRRQAREQLKATLDDAAKPLTVGDKAQAFGGMAIILTLLVAVSAGIYFIWPSGPSPEELALQEAEAAEERRKGFHCLSELDGSQRDLVQAVKQTMNDPSSFRHLETRITPRNSSGQHQLVMKFRGSNAFGATVTNQVVATMRSSDCRIVDWVYL